MSLSCRALVLLVFTVLNVLSNSGAKDMLDTRMIWRNKCSLIRWASSYSKYRNSPPKYSNSRAPPTSRPGGPRHARSGGKHTQLASADAYPPYKFGPYSSLNLPDEKGREGIKHLVSKITDFNELKIFPEIRNVLLKEIKAHTVLRSQNHTNLTTKVKTEGELNGLIIRPTPIQTAAIKIINDRRETSDFFKVFTLAAETGSGKTWAYLAPLLQQLLQGHKASTTKQVEIGENPTTHEPVLIEKNEPFIKHRSGIKSIILVPTHELVDQVYETVEFTGSQLNLNVLKWDTESNFKTFMQNFKSGIDIMITTPGKLHALSKYPSIQHNPKMIFGSVSFCVADEADTLMDPSFVDETTGILRNMLNLETLIFASATIPSQFNKTISHLYPDVINISTPSLHKLPKSIEFRVINASVPPYKGSKIKALAQALYAIHCDGTEQGYEKRAIVFVNKKEDCSKVAEKLSEGYGHDVTYITSQDTPDARRSKVLPFITNPSKLTDPTKPILKVLICTDLLSRGLNFKGIRNVILLDVPSNSADLVHRSGRTGRMNQSGRVFMIINDSDKSHLKGLPKVLRNNRRLG